MAVFRNGSNIPYHIGPAGIAALKNSEIGHVKYDDNDGESK